MLLAVLANKKHWLKLLGIQWREYSGEKRACYERTVEKYFSLGIRTNGWIKCKWKKKLLLLEVLSGKASVVKCLLCSPPALSVTRSDPVIQGLYWGGVGLGDWDSLSGPVWNILGQWLRAQCPNCRVSVSVVSSWLVLTWKLVYPFCNFKLENFVFCFRYGFHDSGFEVNWAVLYF